MMTMRVMAAQPLTLRLAHFPVEVLAGTEGSGPEQIGRALLRAIRLYLNDSGADRPGWAYPDFLRGKEPGGATQLELAIEADLLEGLEDEAGRQGVSISQLAGHAALYYAAELEAGNIPRRILEADDGAVGEV
jgi:hypothetical protein